jgi:hypothetical protein
VDIWNCSNFKVFYWFGERLHHRARKAFRPIQTSGSRRCSRDRIGHGENYPGVVYKAKVLTAFKGIDEKETIFFGPFAGYGVGKEYVVFLSKSEYGLKPNQNADSSRGGIPVFYRIMYDGFSILPSDYECVFDGKAISQECDYSVELNSDQIILPSQIQLFPAGDAGPVSNYCKWVRKSVFFSLLNTLRKSR